MLTVEQFLNAGFKFVDGDKVRDCNKTKIWIITKESANYWNKCGKSFDNYFIEDLIWRKMPKTDKLPVSDECWIQYKSRSPYCISVITTVKVKNVIIPKINYVNTKWRPSIEYTLDELRNKICN